MDTTKAAFAASPYQRALHAACGNAQEVQARALLRITGPVEPQSVRSAFEAILSRHSALRSRLSEHDGLLVQVIEPEPNVAWGDGSGGIVTAELRNDRPEVQKLSLRMPAAIVDAASFVTISRELADHLGGRVLPADPVQFIEFSDWRNEMKPGPSHRPAAARSRYAVHQAVETLDPQVATRLARIAGEVGIDAQDCILAAWMAYLARAGSGATGGIRVATDFRSFDAGLTGLVGPATVYVPLPIECNLDGTFEQLAVAVASARGKLRPDDGWVPPQGGIGFDVDVCPMTVHAGGARIELTDADACAEPLALRLTWTPSTSSIRLTAESEATRTLEGLIVLLSAAVDSVRSPIRTLPAIGRRESAWLHKVAAGPVTPPHDLLPARILAAAERWPDRPAVDDGTISWSFSQLVDRAHRVAAAIDPHAIVAVIAQPSAFTVTAMVGAMLSGAAYVPIDDGLPARRAAQLLEDCGASVVLIPRAGATLTTDLPVIRVDELPASGETYTPPRIHPDDLAYVIYTSGSTGKPKGVMITHGGLANYVAFAASQYDIEGEGTAIVSSSLAFDLCLTTLMVPLAVGRGTVIVPPSPAGVVEALQRTRGDAVLKVTPRHLDLLATILPRDVAAKVKSVVIGGEQLSTAAVVRWRALAPDARLFNEYGPTETVVGSCVYEIPRGIPVEGDTIPIGVPIAGTTLHVLDEYGHLAPTSAEGELHIGGAGGARGYLAAPGLTAARFLPDPFAGGGARMYRTGDIVRRRPDGQLLFIGRIDEQLKLRGYRVEPAEVEAVLRQHQLVSACAVVQSGQSLVAFLVGSPSVLDSAAVARHAADLLPDYMVPARFVVVPDLPVTANGKLDRAALMARHDAREAAVVTLPRTEMERLVSGVWCDVLKIERVDIDARFLEIGGDSLMIIEAAARLQEQAGRPVPPAMLFEHPTVRTLAAELSGEGRMQAVDLGRERAERRAKAPVSRRRRTP
ncbi:MAG TPA: amino acid adenylation domain-containing protein [Thermoanaerobaculia bacterium]